MHMNVEGSCAAGEERGTLADRGNSPLPKMYPIFESTMPPTQNEDACAIVEKRGAAIAAGDVCRRQQTRANTGPAPPRSTYTYHGQARSQRKQAAHSLDQVLAGADRCFARLRQGANRPPARKKRM
uniref:Uncharacterized protein n=1 Tax=Chrysotila carterae TaxID=13221 RepID=A0A7S4EVJ6_CHRCT